MYDLISQVYNFRLQVLWGWFLSLNAPFLWEKKHLPNPFGGSLWSIPRDFFTHVHLVNKLTIHFFSFFFLFPPKSIFLKNMKANYEILEKMKNCKIYFFSFIRIKI